MTTVLLFHDVVKSIDQVELSVFLSICTTVVYCLCLTWIVHDVAVRCHVFVSQIATSNAIPCRIFAALDVEVVTHDDGCAFRINQPSQQQE